MPTYQYACTSCGERLEAMQKFTDDPLTICPSCEGALRKVFSPVGVVFKGSGFYKTDSRSKSSAGAGTKSAASSSSGSDSSTTDTKAGSSDPTAGSGSGDSTPAAKSDTSKSSSSGSSGDRVA